METMGARCCERAVGLATIQRQDNSEGMHGMHFGHTSLCGQPKVDSRNVLAGWFGSVPHQALEPGLVVEKASLLELCKVQHWPIPPPLRLAISWNQELAIAIAICDWNGKDIDGCASAFHHYVVAFGAIREH